MATHVRFVDNSKQFLTELEGLIDIRMDRASEELRDALEKNVSQPGPAPSRPGEFPHKQEGDLAGSFFWHRDTRGGRIIGSSSDHALPLEKKSPADGGRPLILQTLYEMWGRIKRIMAGGR